MLRKSCVFYRASQDSINNIDLFSPVKQLLRSSFAIFVILNDAIKYGGLSLFTQHWGAQKISPRNIILMIHNKPHQDFQYVNILTLPEIRNHITFGENKFSVDQVDQLVRFFSQQD